MYKLLLSAIKAENISLINQLEADNFKVLEINDVYIQWEIYNQNAQWLLYKDDVLYKNKTITLAYIWSHAWQGDAKNKRYQLEQLELRDNSTSIMDEYIIVHNQLIPIPEFYYRMTGKKRYKQIMAIL